jgi:hypothetical protein
VDQPADAYVPPAPFAPPALRSAPLNEVAVLGRSTYPGSPMVPMPVAPPPTAWYPGQGWVPGQPPGRRAAEASARRRTVVTVVAVATALVVLVTALTVANPGASRHSVSLPTNAGDYVKLSTVTGSRIQTIFGSSGTFSTFATNDLVHAKVGIYGHSAASSPTVLFLGFNASDSPAIGRQLRTEDAAQVTEQVLAGAGAGAGSNALPVSVSAGPLGGSIRCSPVHVGGLDAEVGVWADSDTLGIVLLFDPALSPSPVETGGITRMFRSVAEH